jgi:predicted secreted protein
LTLVSDEFTYTKEPEEGTTGGDGGTRGYIFKALKTGKTTIAAKDMFRGELKGETVFNITVQ